MDIRTGFQLTRRGLWRFAPLALPFVSKAHAAETLPVMDSFPSHPPDMVREVVAVSHGNIKRVKELVDARPSLSKAAVDWGFGDWEDALGAASHVGNREIAEYLIGKGARPTLFSATMLGQLDTVKAFLAAQPGVQRIAGPHSISLLAHAKAGGKQAEAVYQYLDGLGDAGAAKTAPISASELTVLTGTYIFGSGATDQVEISEKNGILIFTRLGKSARNLIHAGELTFHPVGTATAKVHFSGAGENATLTVEDPDLILTARRK